MDHTDQITARLDDIAGQLVAALAAHEEEDHSHGGECRTSRATALGYLAHRLGMSCGEALLVSHHRDRFEMLAHEKARAT